ncbi:hypothetical protein ABH920_009427 [Catenulispora sp. EB89]
MGNRGVGIHASFLRCDMEHASVARTSATPRWSRTGIGPALSTFDSTGPTPSRSQAAIRDSPATPATRTVGATGPSGYSLNSTAFAARAVSQLKKPATILRVSIL